jgi:N-acetylmuramoyl-L-alanine amidase
MSHQWCFTLVLLGLGTAACEAHAAELRDLRLWEGPDSTRVVFDLDAESANKVFTLTNPDRVVIDIAGARQASTLKLDTAKGMVKAVRTGPRDGGLRIVLDVSGAIRPQTFALQPSGGYGYRLIVDLYSDAVDRDAVKPASSQILANADAASSATAAAPPAPHLAPAITVPAQAPVVNVATMPAESAPAAAALTSREVRAQSAPPAVAATSPVIVPAARPPEAALPAVATSASASSPTEKLLLGAKPIVVAIDAGHGGEDPGAHGPHGVREKDVTLSIARKLARRINSQPGMRAVLTRDGDYYVGLRERTVKARQAQADLFVSVHCNALVRPEMRGTAVYVLSDHGASNEQARWLANHENAADLVGGVKLQNKDDDLAAVLIDISQSATMEASFDLGSRMLDSLGKVNTLQKPQVQQAGFMVLKSPDIPSVLVETAFITNPQEERLLASDDYQDKLANSIFDGVRGYFSRYRPLQPVTSPRETVALQDDDAPKPVPVSLKRHTSK